MSKRDPLPKPRRLASPIVEHEGQLYIIANWRVEELHVGCVLALVPLTPKEVESVREFHQTADRELYAVLRPRVAERAYLDDLERALAKTPARTKRTTTKRR